MSKPDIRTLSLLTLQVDPRVQQRVELSEATITEYAEAMQAGDVFPPPVVFEDEAGLLWLADGFHRVASYNHLGIVEVQAEVRQGTMRDAILFAVGANGSHGLRRTNADKRRSVMTLLDDAEWSRWSDREIARRAGVSHPFVISLRPRPDTLTGNGYQSATKTYTTRHGTTAVMDTSRIGKSDRAPVQPTLDLSPPKPAPIATPFSAEEIATADRVEAGAKASAEVIDLGAKVRERREADRREVADAWADADAREAGDDARDSGWVDLDLPKNKAQRIRFALETLVDVQIDPEVFARECMAGEAGFNNVYFDLEEVKPIIDRLYSAVRAAAKGKYKPGKTRKWPRVVKYSDHEGETHGSVFEA